MQFCESRQPGLVRPQDPSWCPVAPFFGEPPTAGCQRVFSWVASLRVVKSQLGSWDVAEGTLLVLSGTSWRRARVSTHVLWIVGGRLPCGCTEDHGSLSPLSPRVPGPHGGRGRKCRTPPWACSVCSQSDATRKRVRTCRTRSVQGVGAVAHARKYRRTDGHIGGTLMHQQRAS